MGKHQSYHIFVVDDEPRVCKAISRVLFQKKYNVTSFESAKDCLARLRASAYKCNLLISDIKMPDMDGLELLRKVKPIFYSYKFEVLCFQGVMKTFFS